MDFPNRLETVERVLFAKYPSPLEYLPRLSFELGRPVYIKRDDGLGPGMGGNKTRKLEYLLAEAQRKGQGKVVTFGGLQSNHARLTVACANRLGMQTHLFYFEPRPLTLMGNLLLNSLMGAHLHFIPLGGGGNGMTIEATIRLVRMVAWAMVGPHYFIPVGGHTWLGCLGYVRAAIELNTQARQAGLEKAHLVLAVGSGGTLAGLIAGMAMSHSPIQLLGIDIGKLWRAFPASIASLAGEICTKMGSPQTFSIDQIPLVENTYAGQVYGQPSPEGQAAMRHLARLEGVLLDPVYTAKAFAGMLDLARKGCFPPEEPLIFLHTGGLPALFAFQDNEL